MRRVAGAVFERITSTLVDAFVARADALGERIPKPLPVGPAQPPDPVPTPPGPAMPAPEPRFPDEPGVTT
jgi:hypothetical protein